MKRRLLSIALSSLSGLSRAFGWAGLDSGVYQTTPGATVEEVGERVPGGRRTVSLTATLTFDLTSAAPSLVAVVADAVLEGGDPMALTVRSSLGVQGNDGTYRFTGDYLRDLEPSGTQYGFDWTFSTAASGEVVWKGVTGWWGGHFWQVTIANLTLVPMPQLSISRLESGRVEITWAAEFAAYLLESSGSLSPGVWGAVAEPGVNLGDRVAVAVETDDAPRFFRLRRP